ncbi:hypothetical protein [Streptomyces sp. NPDC048111]|uniref:hypothetical protein n=1 Tax=Streptomyces sp. NPDC048111 TaxID=3365500 RepID=UPI003718DD84
MSDFHPDDESLSRALKRAADAGGRAVLPEPAERVAARGLRRRRRHLATLAACAVCLLAGSGAALGLRLQQSDPVPPASVPADGTPSPADDSGQPSLRPSPSFPDAETDTATATPSGPPLSGSPPSGSPPSGSPRSRSPLSGSPLSGSPLSGTPSRSLPAPPPSSSVTPTTPVR